MARPVSFLHTDDGSGQEEIGETQILAALLGIAQIIGDLTDLDEALDAIVRIAPSLLRVDRCAFLGYDDVLREFYTVTCFAPSGRAKAFERLRISESDMPRLAQRLVAQRLPAIVKETTRDLSLPATIVRSLGVKAALLVPLSARGRFLGVLWLDHSSAAHYFTSKEINVVQGIATMVGVAMDNAQGARARDLVVRRFEALARVVADGVITLGPDYRILGLDATAEDLLGWQSTEVRGRRVHEVFDITEAEASVAWRRDAGAPSPAPKDLELRAHDGTRISCEVLTIPVRDETGSVAQVLYVLRNLSGAKGVRAKAMDALRDLAQAQAGVPRE